MRRIMMVFLFLLLMGACAPNSVPEAKTERQVQVSVESVRNSGYSRDLREQSYIECKRLINQSFDGEGVVLFEECGKNCLGGCPNSGPQFCSYAVNVSGCPLYVESKVTSFMGYPEEVKSRFRIGERVLLRGRVREYTNGYCGDFDTVRHEFFCDYEGYVTAYKGWEGFVESAEYKESRRVHWQQGCEYAGSRTGKQMCESEELFYEYYCVSDYLEQEKAPCTYLVLDVVQ